jgi:asparagine synthase (glutamine-hydrolysing)
MSGVAGWVGAPAPEADAALAWMAAGLPGPEPASPVARARIEAGLAVRGGWSGGFADDGLWVAYAGTPRWTHETLAALARQRGHGHALAEAFRRFGPGLLDYLAGHWSIAVLDPGERRLLAAIDRAGVHTLCYAPLSGGVVFGSTTDVVRRHPHVTSTLSHQAIYDFFHFLDRIPAPETIYREQRKLAPGECLTFQNGSLTVRPYWRMRYAPAKGVPAPELEERLRTVLAESVRLGLEDGTRTGAFLSGGLDSSTVSGLLAKAEPQGADAFTIGFHDPRYDETRYAHIAARHFGLRHHLRTVTPEDVLDVFDGIATLYDEPFANSSAIPAYFCARLAAQAGMDVLLAGDGGDELFAGNARYLDDRVFQHYRRIPAWLRRLVIEPAALSLPAHPPIALLKRAGRYVRLARLPVPVRAAADNIFDRIAVSALFSRDFLAEIDLDAPNRLVSEIFDAPSEGDDLQRFMHLDLRITLADSDLRKVGRMCELAGIRVRYPMLDDAVLEFSGSVPSGLLCRGGHLRDFYKRAFAGFLPREVLTKPKHGFGLPFEEFLQSHRPLREFAHASLRALGKRGYFDRGFLDRLAPLVLAGTAPSLAGVWDMVCLESWLASRDHTAGAVQRAAAGGW